MQSRPSLDPPAPRRSFLPFISVSLDADAATLRRELETLQRSARDAWRLRRELAAFFLVTVALFGIAQVVRELIHPQLSPLRQMGYSWGFLLLLLGPIGWFVRHQPLPLRSLGLTTQGARESLREAAVVTLGLVAACVALRVGPALRGEPWLVWGSVASYSRGEFALFLLAYGPHCFLQEFVARGVIQTSLERLLPADAGPLAPVLVTSVLFGVFHLYVSPSFALITFVVSALFGLFYERRRTLVGVTAVHAALGLASVAVGLN